MEAVIKINIIDEKESEWIIGDYANGKFKNLTEQHFVDVIESLISDAIVLNHIYYDCDDADQAVREISPTILSILLNPRFSQLRDDYDILVELVTYLTVRLA